MLNKLVGINKSIKTVCYIALQDVIYCIQIIEKFYFSSVTISACIRVDRPRRDVSVIYSGVTVQHMSKKEQIKKMFEVFTYLF